MRELLFVLLGLVCGALAGIATAAIFFIVYVDLMGLGDFGGDRESRLAGLMALGLVMAVLGGVTGSILVGRRTGFGGGGGTPLAIGLIVLSLTGLVALWLAGVIV